MIIIMVLYQREQVHYVSILTLKRDFLFFIFLILQWVTSDLKVHFCLSTVFECGPELRSPLLQISEWTKHTPAVPRELCLFCGWGGLGIQVVEICI